MEAILNIRKQKKNGIGVWVYVGLAISLVISLIAAVTHEPWIDEIYAWQISKFSFYDIFYEMRYEGHFMLWSLILYPFSHLNFPLRTIGCVSWLLNAIALFYFVRKSPFPSWTKVLVAFTVPFLYINPAISRCYVLIPLFLFPMAALFCRISKATEKGNLQNDLIFAGMLLAFMANTHVYSEGFTLTYGFFLLWFVCRCWSRSPLKDKLKSLLGLGIAVIGGMVALAQVLPSFSYSSVFLEPPPLSIQSVMYLGGFLSQAGIKEPYMAILTVMVFVIICGYLLRKDTRSFIFLFTSNLYMGIICVFVYGIMVPNRAVMWFYFIIFSLWITTDKIKQSTYVSNGTLFNETIAFNRFFSPSLMLVVVSLFLLQPDKNIFDFRNLYSGESRFAYYLKDMNLLSEEIYSTPNSWNCAIMEYVPEYHFFNVKDSKILTPRGDRAGFDDKNAEKYIKGIFERNPQKKYIYIVDSDVFKGKTNFVQRNKLPYKYEVLYPLTTDQRSYFIQYFLLKIFRFDSNDVSIEK